jgi:N-acetylneuraminic acid mutarotase
MKHSSTLFLQKPSLLPFAALNIVRDTLLRPDRKLRGSRKPVDKRGGRWNTARALPSWRYEFGAAKVGDEIFVVGGLTLPTVYTITRRVEAYSLKTDRWRRVAPYPVFIHHPSVVSVGEVLYVVGGNGWRITPYGYVFAYHPEEDRWIRKKDMPTPRGALGAAIVDGKIYAVGGGTNHVARSELEVYDPWSDTWKKLTPMPTPREHLAVATAGGYVFAMGGYTKSLSECLKVNEMYDPKTDTWEKRAPLPLATSGFAAVGLGKSIFIFGGEQGWSVSPEVHEYRITEDRWIRKTDMLCGRYASVAVAVGDNIHVIGGNDEIHGYAYSLDHDVFHP